MAVKGKAVTKLDSTYMQQYDAYVERQRRKKKRLFRRLVLFAMIVLLAMGTMAAYHMRQRALQAEKQKEYEELQAELMQLEKQEQNLREEIDLLKNEEYVLDIARTNYFFSDDGEIIFKLPGEEPSY